MLPTIAPARPQSSGSTTTAILLAEVEEDAGTLRPTRRYYRPSCGPRDVRSAIARSCRGRAWRPAQGPTLPASVPVWSSAAHWLETLAAALQTTEGEKLRAAAKVSADTLIDVAAADARAADSRTGRGVTTAHDTVANALGCSAKTVQRARSLLEALGFARTVVLGRYLTADERAAAHAHHGGHQRRMASERALLVPRSLSNVHLPRGGCLSSHVPSHSDVPKRADTRTGAAGRQESTTANRHRRTSRPPIGVQRLAAGLAQRLPWLARGHIGSLCHTLLALGLDDTGWTAHDVIDMLDRRNVALGLYSPASGSQRDPLALFAHQVRAARADVQEPPRLRRGREAAARATEHARQRAEQAAHAARIKAELADPLVQARIADAKRQIREQLLAARTTTARAAAQQHTEGDEAGPHTHPEADPRKDNNA